MSEESSKRDDNPQKEYARLYNGQYAQLTTLKKSVDPRGEHSSYLEATLKKHYPKVYKDMIHNDYIVTSSDHIQDELNNNDNKQSQEQQRKSIQLSKQLDEVIVGKQIIKRLSNPIRPIAQCYVDIITRDSSLSPAHRQVFCSYLNTYLNTYIDKIPFYL